MSEAVGVASTQPHGVTSDNDGMRPFAICLAVASAFAGAGCDPDCAADPYQPFCTPPDLPTQEDAFGDFCAPELVHLGVENIYAVANPNADTPGRYVILTEGASALYSAAVVRQGLGQCNLVANAALTNTVGCDARLTPEQLSECSQGLSETAFNECMVGLGLRDHPGVWSYVLRPGRARPFQQPAGNPAPFEVYFTTRFGHEFAEQDDAKSPAQLATCVSSEMLTPRVSVEHTQLCHASDYGTRLRGCGSSEHTILYCVSQPAPEAPPPSH